MNISLLSFGVKITKIFFAKKEEKKMNPTWKPVFYNLVLEVTLPHFCQILCIRSESASLTHTQGKGITQRHRHQENHLRICLPQCISSVLTSPFYRLSLRSCHFCKACPRDTRGEIKQVYKPSFGSWFLLLNLFLTHLQEKILFT